MGEKMAHKYPIIPDIGLKVHKTFVHKFEAFGREWKFNVRSQSEANIAKSCLNYYKSMWEGKYCESVSKDDTVVDVGAHVGFFAVPMASQVRMVHAYEPSPANYRLLTQNVKLNLMTGLVRSVEMAVGARSEVVTLNLGVQGTTGHSITHQKRGGVSTEVVCVDLQSIVDFCKPTVLKLDCEGAEWDILTNPDLLGNIRIIVAELHKVKQHHLPSMQKVLKQAGMKVVTQPNSWFTKLIAYRR
jgi:FkbM family methyltransferase